MNDRWGAMERRPREGGAWRDGLQAGRPGLLSSGRRRGAWSHSQAQTLARTTRRTRTGASCRERTSLRSQATLCGHLLWQPQDTHTLPSEAHLPPSSRSQAAVPTATHPPTAALFG